MLRVNKIAKIMFVGSIMLFFIWTTDNTVFATSWAEIEPEVVNNKAEVIVRGTYDFSSKAISSDFIFQGFDFNVTDVYKGETLNKITAGIDAFDVGWVEEFQKDGGEFLLFLEKSEDTTFLIPVGGPNGMIQISNEKVENHSESSNNYYNEFLNDQPKNETMKGSSKPINEPINKEKDSKSFSSLIYISLILTTLVVLFLIARYFKNK